MTIVQAPSPNFSARPVSSGIKTIVLHNTAGSMPGCLNWLRDKRAQASAHYLVDRAGTVFQLVDEKNMAWHAMQANGYSIGIEIEAFADARGMTTPQESALKELVASIRTRHKISLAQVKAHRQVNPGATACPVLIWPKDEDFEQWKQTLDQPTKEAA